MYTGCDSKKECPDAETVCLGFWRQSSLDNVA